MTAIKAAIFTACLIGMLSTVINIIAPEGKMKKHLMTVLGITALLAVVGNFTADGFVLSIGEISAESGIDPEVRDIERQTTDIFLEQAKAEYEEYFFDLLNKNDISTAKVSCKLELSSDNELSLTEICAEIDDISQKEKARQLIENKVSETVVKIMQAENDGKTENTDKQVEKQP